MSHPCIESGYTNIIFHLQITSLLTMGLYPNVCYHMGKRKVLTMENKAALVHKSSVNCSNRDCFFQSPFFVFGEKVREIVEMKYSRLAIVMSEVYKVDGFPVNCSNRDSLLSLCLARRNSRLVYADGHSYVMSQ
jgi:hypothetical protein